jgi:protoheme IX farnesyltransferase
VGVAPWLIGAASAVYGVTATLAGALLLAFVWRVRSGGREAKALFGYSILYLFVLFAMLLVDHALFSNMSFSSWGLTLAAR